jgi:hypothetical protein
MTSKETHDTALAALECLREAVRQEFARKALLGQDVIINRNGKPTRISAAEALAIAQRHDR